MAYEALIDRMKGPLWRANDEGVDRVEVSKADYAQMLSLFESWCRSHVPHPDGLPDERNLGGLSHDWKLVEVRPDGMPPYKYTCTGGCLQVTNDPYDALCPDKVAAVMRRLYDYIHQLRCGIERILREQVDSDCLIAESLLRNLLDDVDARDSVRWLEEREEVIRNETREQVCALLLGMTVVVGTDAIPMSSNHVLAAQGVLRLAIDRIEKMAKKPQKERWGTEDVMLYPGQRDALRERRRSFRCECGSNVFRKSLDMPLHYRCNGCDATYTGEGYSDGPADPVAP